MTAETYAMFRKRNAYHAKLSELAMQTSAIESEAAELRMQVYANPVSVYTSIESCQLIYI